MKDFFIKVIREIIPDSLQADYNSYCSHPFYEFPPQLTEAVLIVKNGIGA